MGLQHPEAAKVLHVSLRTLQNWLSGRHEVPYAAYKLLRLLRYMELPGESWSGWHFSRGQLITPEGRAISGHDGSWWSLLVRQSRGFTSVYADMQAAKAAALAPEGPRLRGVAGDRAKGLAGSVAHCYAEPCSSEKQLHRATPETNTPHGNHGDSKPITEPGWGHPDTISGPWPLISDFLLPSISSPATTAIGSESPLIVSLASPLTPICDSLSRSRLPLQSPLPPLLRSLQSLPSGPTLKLSSAASFSLPLSPSPSQSPYRTPSLSLAPSLPRLSAPTSPPGIGATARLHAPEVSA
jgi:hypothetical protein